jgi:pimeloyl-ACP methyl ester carboxylesterase
MGKEIDSSPASFLPVPMYKSTTYHTATVDGIKLSYRKAGTHWKPCIVLLHAGASSSAMFEHLIPLLAARYHVLAPDYPASGLSDAPPGRTFSYTFEHFAELIGGLLDHLGVHKCTYYMTDYGGPIGFRLALARPERVQALIIQNAAAHEAGLSDWWDARRLFWNDPAKYWDEVLAGFTSIDGLRRRHIGASPHVERYNPETWLTEWLMLSRPGIAEVQTELFYNYRSNLHSFTEWQTYLRLQQPKTLVLWGRYDLSLTVEGATSYKNELPDAEIHILDAGHFALEEALEEVTGLVLEFQARHGLTLT